MAVTAIITTMKTAGIIMSDEWCDVSPLALLRLQIWLSPTFPIGSYSYSHGLEWAVEAEHVRALDFLGNVDKPLLVELLQDEHPQASYKEGEDESRECRSGAHRKLVSSKDQHRPRRAPAEVNWPSLSEILYRARARRGCSGRGAQLGVNWRTNRRGASA